MEQTFELSTNQFVTLWGMYVSEKDLYNSSGVSWENVSDEFDVEGLDDLIMGCHIKKVELLTTEIRNNKHVFTVRLTT